MRTFAGRTSSPVAPIAHLVGAIAAVVTLFIVAGILLYVFDANASNTLVSHVERWSSTLTTPFHNLFTPHGLKANIATNWGIAAAVYLLAGGILRRLLMAL
jgi:uncharacterized membrane protein